MSYPTFCTERLLKSNRLALAWTLWLQDAALLTVVGDDARECCDLGEVPLCPFESSKNNRYRIHPYTDMEESREKKLEAHFWPGVVSMFQLLKLKTLQSKTAVVWWHLRSWFWSGLFRHLKCPRRMESLQWRWRVANYRSWEWLPVSGPHKVQFNDWSNEMEREINSDSLGHDFWVWLKFYFQSCTLHSFNYLHSQGRKWMSVTWLCDQHLWRLQDVLPALKKLNSTRWRRQQKTSGTYLRQKLAAYPQSVFPDQICKAACPGTGAQRCLRGQRVVQMWRSMRKCTSPRRNQNNSSVLPLLFVSFAEMIFFSRTGRLSSFWLRKWLFILQPAAVAHNMICGVGIWWRVDVICCWLAWSIWVGFTLTVLFITFCFKSRMLCP